MKQTLCHLGLLALISLSPSGLRAQLTWHPISTNTQPPAIPDGVGYDAVRNKTMWCGSNPATGVVEVWSYDGIDWTPEANAGAPPADHRFVHSAAWDENRAAFVLYGRGETWEWSESSQWRNATPTLTGAVPGDWEDVAMTFDPSRNETLMFGGSRVNPATGEEIYGDRLWAWDGSEWQVYAPPGDVPYGRARCSMTHDPQTGTCVLHGGRSSFYTGRVQTYVVHYDTWLWDGSTWSRPGSNGGGAQSGAGVLGHGMAYDAGRGRILSVAGANLSTLTPDTWDFDGTDWIQRSIGGPSEREDGHLVYDAGNEQLLLIGGTPNPEMWALRTDHPGRHDVVGTSCGGGAQGAPSLVGGARPYLGDVYTIELQNLPLTPSPIFLVLSGYPFPTPLDLSLIGMPQCSLFNETHVVRPATSIAGSGSLEFGFRPTAPQLVGSSIHHQAFVVDAQANALGLAATNSLATTIGLR